MSTNNFWEIIPSQVQLNMQVGEPLPTYSVEHRFPNYSTSDSHLTGLEGFQVGSLRAYHEIEYADTVEWLDISGFTNHLTPIADSGIYFQELGIQNEAFLTNGTHTAIVKCFVTGIINGARVVVDYNVFNVSLNVSSSIVPEIECEEESITIEYTPMSPVPSFATLHVSSTQSFTISKDLLGVDLEYTSRPAGEHEIDVVTSQYGDHMLPGTYNGTIIISTTNVSLEIPLTLVIRPVSGLSVSPNALHFEGVKGMIEPDVKNIRVLSNSSVTIEKPHWLERLPSDENLDLIKFKPINSSHLQASTYSGVIRITDENFQYIEVPVTYLLKPYTNHPFAHNKYFFSKDLDLLDIHTENEETYLELRLEIAVFDIGSETPQVLEKLYNIPFINGVAKTYPGRLIHNYFNKQVPKIETTSLVIRDTFIYKPMIVRMQLEEREYVSEDSIRNFPSITTNFIKGYRPSAWSSHNLIVLQHGNKTHHRIYRQEGICINYFLKGNATIELSKNNADPMVSEVVEHGKIRSFEPLIGLSPGDEVKITFKNETGGIAYETFYHCLPEPKERNVVHFLNSYNVLERLTFGGRVLKPFQLTHDDEQVFHGFKKHSKRVSTEEETTWTLNTGFILKDDLHKIYRLMKSKECWISVPNSRVPVSALCMQEDLPAFDSNRALIEFNLSFKINPENNDQIYL